MLIMFKVKNFASLKDDVILDLRATTYKQHMSHLHHISDDLKLLKTTAIYGANASGKSNLIAAMFFMEKYIFEQFISKTKEEAESSLEVSKEIDLDPFALTDKTNHISEFEIIFIYNNKQIQYGFECTRNTVLTEWYDIDNQNVFYRKRDTIEYGKKYEKQLKVYNKVPTERLYLSVLEYFLEEDSKKNLLQDFTDFFEREYNVHLEIFLEASIKKLGGSARINSKLYSNKKYKNKIEKYLKQIDVGISGLEVQSKNILDPKTGKEKVQKIVKTIHNVYNDTGAVIRKELFDLNQESTGTLRFLSYIQDIIDMTEQGGVFIVDEMSARLHPLLTKLIVDIFQSSSNKKAQLIFTTHDISLLNKDQFRRDEVIFIDKDDKGVSRIYALSDLKVREDATFNKDYLQGKYGAIPIFNYDEIWGDE